MKPKSHRKKQRKPIALPGRMLTFPQVRGKTLEAVESADIPYAVMTSACL
ncbi:MAG: hypothetical protein LAP21_25880 [Acidobacteriia bacterium]|nr:hypothetical protein [Terriglobia bacterium]